MKLPAAGEAYVPREKLVDYLLCETHPTGASKADFFRGLGFREHTASQLEEELLNVANGNDVEESEVSPYGTKYVVIGEIVTPIHRRARVRTVWIIEPPDERPRFVTAYPA